MPTTNALSFTRIDEFAGAPHLYHAGSSRLFPLSMGRLLQAAALRAHHDLTQARRLRLDAVGTRLPGVLWFVIVAGALLSLASAFFFHVEDPRLHAIQTLLVALFIGVVIFMILALDRPFHGELGVGPESYQLVYDQLMKP
jgi:hypothetical protein